MNNIDAFLDDKNIKLNKQQKSAVENINGKFLLLAVPGSGKTTVIVTRIGYMIYEKKILPQSILTLTYSVSAANDMRKRYISIFGDNQKPQFRTIHSFCVMVLNEFAKKTGRKPFELIRNSNEIISSLYLKIKHEFPSDSDIKDILTRITYCNNLQLPMEEIQKNEDTYFCRIYKAYAEYKIQNRLMDFDDQLKYAYDILKKYPSILEKFKNTYKYINVDEAQDTSKIQHEIIKLLVNDNLFMVGDEDQSIYRFRAAYPQALLNFQNEYKKSKVMLMETNYRSTPQILKVANTFIKQNKNRRDKNIVAFHKNGESIKHIIFQNIDDEFKYILEEVNKNNEKLAILYRNNDSAIPIVDMFRKDKIKYTIREAESNFFSNKVVKDIQFFINFYLNPSNMDFFNKIYYKINCGISKELMQKLQEQMQKRKDLTILDNLIYLDETAYWQRKKLEQIRAEMRNWKTYSSYYIVKSIVKDLEYENYLERKKSEFTNYAQKINVIYALAKQNPDIKEFLTKLVELEFAMKEGSCNNPNVILSTIHGSKGLEYDRVLLIDAISGVLPAIEKPKDFNNPKYEEYEEEVRLFYVAITRAKKRLEILTYKTAYDEIVGLSPFVTSIVNTKYDL